MKLIEVRIKNKSYNSKLNEKPESTAAINLDTVEYIKESPNGKAEFQFINGYLTAIENYEDILAKVRRNIK